MELLDSSSPTHIVLGSVRSEAGGEYKCEVSQGPPRFSTAARTTHLQVVGEYQDTVPVIHHSCITSDLPASAPAIYGLRSVYGEGEFVNLTCESGPSSPVTRLSWSLNNVRIQPESPLVSTMLPVYPLPDKKGISRTFLSLLVTEETFLK